MPDHTSYRFTPDDENAVVARITDVHGAWQRELGAKPMGSEAVLSLVRVGAHAIGCSTFDLRDVELEWIERQVHSLLNPEV